MFQSAVIKLTAFYFALIFFVCVVFSTATFSIASRRLSTGAENQEQIFRQYGNYPPPPKTSPGQESESDDFDPNGEIQEQIKNQIDQDRQDLLRAVLFANIAILSASTVLCYFFAKRTLEPIEKAHKAQSRFTADASHELRTPLTVMKTEIEVALLQKLSADELRDVLKSNLEEVERLSALSNQLLGLTRVEVSKSNFSNLDLSKLVEFELNSLEEKNSIQIEKHIDQNIHILGVDELCKNLIDILISNAIQYHGDKDLNISVSLSLLENKQVELKIRDGGIGIDESDIPNIFDRFYRGKTATKNRKMGHGLGLSLAREIVNSHNGHISVKSKIGEFTEFMILFNQYDSEDK